MQRADTEGPKSPHFSREQRAAQCDPERRGSREQNNEVQRKEELKALQLAAGAVAAAVLAGREQSWLLALHAHRVPLPQVAHPAAVRALPLHTARPQGHQLELHTVPATQQRGISSETTPGQLGLPQPRSPVHHRPLIKKNQTKKSPHPRSLTAEHVRYLHFYEVKQGTKLLC